MEKILLTAFIFNIFYLLRNILIFTYREKALKKVFDLTKYAIYNDEPYEPIDDKYNSYGSYAYMLLDLRKWTYKQLYPDL